MNKLIPLLALLIFTTHVSGTTHGESDTWTGTVVFENDLFADTDSNYTNGIKLNLISPDLTKFRYSDRINPWIVWLSENLPFINDEEEERENLHKNIGLTIGQKIFTLQDIQETALIPDDRPYAGWLYFGTAFHTKDKNQLDTLEIQLGMVGSYSLAENAQNFIHKLRGIPTAKGWDNQLNNEPAFAVIYEKKWRSRPRNIYKRFGYDGILHAGAAAGTAFSYTNFGTEIRFGWNIPADFGTSLIRPGGDTNSPIDSNDPRLVPNSKRSLVDSRQISLHGFAAVSGRVVLRDIFLDGNTFSDSHSVDKKYLVGDLIFGVSAIYKSTKLSFAKVFRTREFVGQQSSHKFGSISLSVTF